MERKISVLERRDDTLVPEHHQILYGAVANMNIWWKGAEALQEQGGQVGRKRETLMSPQDRTARPVKPN
jgi:hypothetical protein